MLDLPLSLPLEPSIGILTNAPLTPVRNFPTLPMIDRHESLPAEDPGQGAGLNSLTRLPAPVPRGLAEVFGYSGQARFVGFYLEPTVDELMVDDGQSSATGEWYAFERWREHPAVASHLQDVNLGDADLDATHWLIIDRERGELYVAHVSTAQAFLQDQHPSPPQLQPNQMAEIDRRIEAQQRAMAEMLAFFDHAADATRDSPPERV